MRKKSQRAEPTPGKSFSLNFRGIKGRYGGGENVKKKKPIKYERNEEKTKQAGAELCQAHAHVD